MLKPVVFSRVFTYSYLLIKHCYKPIHTHILKRKWNSNRHILKTTSAGIMWRLAQILLASHFHRFQNVPASCERCLSCQVQILFAALPRSACWNIWLYLMLAAINQLLFSVLYSVMAVLQYCDYISVFDGWEDKHAYSGSRRYRIIDRGKFQPLQTYLLCSSF